MAITLITSTSVSGNSTSSIVFSSIPQTYNFLYLTGSVASQRSNAIDTVLVKPNGQTGNMFYSGARNNASATVTWENVNGTWQFPCPGASVNLTFLYGAFTMWISHYTFSSRAKMMLVSGSAIDNLIGSSNMFQGGGRWDVTNAALTSLTIDLSATGSNFRDGSRIDLYGVN